jgi:hypothetical protein
VNNPGRRDGHRFGGNSISRITEILGNKNSVDYCKKYDNSKYMRKAGREGCDQSSFSKEKSPLFLDRDSGLKINVSTSEEPQAPKSGRDRNFDPKRGTHTRSTDIVSARNQHGDFYNSQDFDSRSFFEHMKSNTIMTLKEINGSQYCANNNQAHTPTHNPTEKTQTISPKDLSSNCGPLHEASHHLRSHVANRDPITNSEKRHTVSPTIERVKYTLSPIKERVTIKGSLSSLTGEEILSKKPQTLRAKNPNTPVPFTQIDISGNGNKGLTRRGENLLKKIVDLTSGNSNSNSNSNNTSSISG